MSSFFQIGGHFQEGLAPEPFARPAAGAVLLHCGIVVAIVLYGVIGGFFHHNLWGGAGPGGAIQVNITSSIPLPSDHPPNQNVLATEKPSEAPAPPEPKAKQAEDDTAIPIQGKPKKPEQKETPKTPPEAGAGAPEPRAVWRAGWFGDAARRQRRAPPRAPPPSLTRTLAVYSAGTSTISIARWMPTAIVRWRTRTRPRGASAYISFMIARDGSVSQVRLDRTSGSPTWDTSLRPRGATRRYLWTAAGAVPREQPDGFVLL